MQAQNSQLPPKPPGAVNALMSGFNAVTDNLTVILFPAALDIFLWLGPRLKADTFFFLTIEQVSRFLGVAPAWLLPADAGKAMSDINFFSSLRTHPLGIFSLMFNNQSDNSPLGVRLEWKISDGLMPIGVLVLLTFTGLFLGSLYFYFVSRAALKPKTGPGLLRVIFHSLPVWSVWTFFYFITLPFLPFGALLLTNNPIVILFIFLLLTWPVTWAGLVVFFSTHGVFAMSKNAFASLGQNFYILRYAMPPMGWFALIAIVISFGMDIVWLKPAIDSWMALIGIFGHAFIATGLLAGSFIFYRDLNSWVDEALAWVKAQQITSARA